MELATRVQILDEAVWVSLCTNALGKGLNSSVLPAVIVGYWLEDISWCSFGSWTLGTNITRNTPGT